MSGLSSQSELAAIMEEADDKFVQENLLENAQWKKLSVEPIEGCSHDVNGPVMLVDLCCLRRICALCCSDETDAAHRRYMVHVIENVKLRLGPEIRKHLKNRLVK